MDERNGAPLQGPYTLKNLGQQLKQQFPALARNWQQLLPDLLSPERLELKSHLAAHLRLGKLFGCPLCLRLFPPLLMKAGLEAQHVEEIVCGELRASPPQVRAAVSWIEAAFATKGQKPELVPAAAMVLNAHQRAYLLNVVRLEMIIHATGLMFLPHAMIQRALQRHA
jgi:hypothetical protein